MAGLARLVLFLGFVLGLARAASAEAPALKDAPSAAPTPASPLRVGHDPGTGTVTVENGRLKAVFHSRTRDARDRLIDFGNKGGGNLYELYWKPTDPQAEANLIPLCRGGTVASTAYGIGFAGVGSTQMYVIPNPPDKPPTAEQASGYDPAVSDNCVDAVENAPPKIEPNRPEKGRVRITFDFLVGNRHVSRSPLRDQNVYRMVKTWEVEPEGRIRLCQRWELLRNAWIAEPATRSQFSWDRGWTTLVKTGHTWGKSPCDDGAGGNGLAPPCNDERVEVPIGGVMSDCWNSLNRFHAQRVTLTGSRTAPDVSLAADNNGLGFEGGGLWKLLRAITKNKASDAVFEQCTYNVRGGGGGGGDAAHCLGFFAWWGGDPNPKQPNPDRYRYADIADPAVKAWEDSYVIEFGPPSAR